MPSAGPLAALRGLPEPVRRRLEVARAMASQSLVTTHARYGLRLVRLLRDVMPFDDVIDRYLEEMGLSGTLAGSTRTRILVGIEEQERGGPVPREGQESEEEDDVRGMDRIRRLRPDRVVRDIRDRQRRQEDTERVLRLGLAQAEEGVILTHIENALDYVALLDEHYSIERAVEHYNGELGVAGCRAQTVLQRVMCRVADAQLPPPEPPPIEPPAPEA